MPGDLFCERKKFEYIHEIRGFFEEGTARTYGEIIPLVIPEEILISGNQYIKYRRNTEEYSEFFKAAEKGDFKEIKKWLDSGADINTIDEYGDTVLFKYICSQFDSEKGKGDIDSIKELISSGGNPAIYGAGIGNSPLDNACRDINQDMLVFLLDCGVSPHLWLYLDDPCEELGKTLLERTERWAEGDPNIDEEPDEEYQKILEILLRYE